MKFPRWIIGWKATDAEIRMSTALHAILDIIEELPEEERDDMIDVTFHHLDGIRKERK